MPVLERLDVPCLSEVHLLQRTLRNKPVQCGKGACGCCKTSSDRAGVHMYPGVQLLRSLACTTPTAAFKRAGSEQAIGPAADNAIWAILTAKATINSDVELSGLCHLSLRLSPCPMTH